MKKLFILQAALLIFMTGCASEKIINAPKPGSDRDPHGCIGSAGYLWCERTNQCERPWKLAERKAFADTREAFRTFCKNPPQ